nr:MAG TPA: hypothetical protein [Caudoviricetes sp.]
MRCFREMKVVCFVYARSKSALRSEREILIYLGRR